MPIEDKDKKDQLLKLVRTAIEKDTELREKFNMGEKFRFIRDRLNALVSRIEESLIALEKESDKSKEEISSDETIVYVYLFNAQGAILKTWNKMLNQSVFYEYSVNRPIYSEKSYVQSLIRGKANKQQHGFLAVVVKKENILPTSDSSKDLIGNPVIRVKEGSLSSTRLISFTHNNIEYVLNDDGELVKKEE